MTGLDNNCVSAKTVAIRHGQLNEITKTIVNRPLKYCSVFNVAIFVENVTVCSRMFLLILTFPLETKLE